MYKNFEQLEHSLEEHYGKNPDPWGLEPKRALADIKVIWPFYKYYFDVRVHGKDYVKDQAYMVVSNHTGQIPIDGMLICTAFATELDKPRFLRPLVERFLTSMPFLGRWSSEGGAVLGDRINCLNLLKRGESVLIFPEGVRGIAKNTKDHYKLQRFTRGFLRMAIAGQAEILPIAVVGAEEFFPYVWHFKKLAKLLKIPALPLSINLFPFPSPVDIYIGEPYLMPTNLSPEALDEELEIHLIQIEKRIQELTEHGLKNRRTIMQRLKS
ncbi:MAG: acyltransferase family protein [Bacteriovorax sp.]|jgi:1-acyl-sn-glycerol-3-phosphate acyltransferase|nr:acyltransferase family protein [Bacteriovorax sp.]